MSSFWNLFFPDFILYRKYLNIPTRHPLVKIADAASTWRRRGFHVAHKYYTRRRSLCCIFTRRGGVEPSTLVVGQPLGSFPSKTPTSWRGQPTRLFTQIDVPNPPNGLLNKGVNYYPNTKHYRFVLLSCQPYVLRPRPAHPDVPIPEILYTKTLHGNSRSYTPQPSRCSEP